MQLLAEEDTYCEGAAQLFAGCSSTEVATSVARERHVAHEGDNPGAERCENDGVPAKKLFDLPAKATQVCKEAVLPVEADVAAATQPRSDIVRPHSPPIR